jgi:hypothetical protein
MKYWLFDVRQLRWLQSQSFDNSNPISLCLSVSNARIAIVRCCAGRHRLRGCVVDLSSSSPANRWVSTQPRSTRKRSWSCRDKERPRSKAGQQWRSLPGCWLTFLPGLATTLPIPGRKHSNTCTSSRRSAPENNRHRTVGPRGMKLSPTAAALMSPARSVVWR